MSRLNLQNRIEGHRVQGPSNRDLEQKLTYQQLLNINHDLSKENQQLRSISERLGKQLRNLHTQFDIRPRQQNSQLYNAIGSQPILHQYELTLIPLFDAYESKIQQFQSGFQTINEEFINLQKKYIQSSNENQRLRADLTDRTKQLIEVYRSGSSQKLGADFGQIILTQINQKQKFLAEENTRLQREFQKSKSQAEKFGRQLTQSKKKEQEVSAKLRQLQLLHRQSQAESKSLKQKVYQEQSKINELQSSNKQVQNNLQRAMSQVTQLTKDRDGILRNYEALKNRFEQYVIQTQEYDGQRNYYQQRNPLQETNKIQQNGDDVLKKLTKLQKDYDNLSRERNKLKEQLEQLTVNLDEANQRIEQVKKKIDLLDGQKRTAEMGEAKNKKLLQQLTEKTKQDLQRLKRQHQQQIKNIEDDFYSKIDAKQKKNAELQETLDRLKLERDKLQQENIIHTTLSNQASKGGRSKDTERIAQKLKQKLAINEELFRQQLQIVENDNVYLKKEAENFKNESKERAEEIRKLRQQLQKVKRQLNEVQEKHTITLQQIKRVKNQYEINLKDKERQFQQKIKEIKIVIQQSDRRRKSQRQKVAESSRQYKKVLQQIRNTYEQRIRVLQTQGFGQNSKARKDQY